jgi:hypothetical protein
MNLDDAVAGQVAAGAQIVQQRWEAPPGPGVRLRHPDDSERDLNPHGSDLRLCWPPAECSSRTP